MRCACSRVMPLGRGRRRPSSRVSGRVRAESLLTTGGDPASPRRLHRPASIGKRAGGGAITAGIWPQPFTPDGRRLHGRNFHYPASVYRQLFRNPHPNTSADVDKFFCIVRRTAVPPARRWFTVLPRGGTTGREPGAGGQRRGERAGEAQGGGGHRHQQQTEPQDRRARLKENTNRMEGVARQGRDERERKTDHNGRRSDGACARQTGHTGLPKTGLVRADHGLPATDGDLFGRAERAVNRTQVDPV